MCCSTHTLLPCALHSARWAGVPFVLKAGKALNERKAEIRVQLRATPHFVFNGEPESMRNEVRQAVLHSRAAVLVQLTTLAAHSSRVCAAAASMLSGDPSQCWLLRAWC